jgi:uncharacterized lipoprotein YmbA
MRSLARALIALLVLSGCAGSPPAQFYTLSALDVPGVTPAAETQYAIVVGPAVVPASVDRPQLVLRRSENRVALLEQARWAEPLASAIPQTIARNLAQILNSSRVMPYPHSPDHFDYQVFIEVLRFDSEMGEAATVEVAWTVRRSDGGEPALGRMLVRERVSGAGYEELVAAHSRALRAVSAEIAQTMRRQHGIGRTGT